MTGEALKLKAEVARLMSRHRLAPIACAPAAPLPPVEGDWIFEGFAAPATIDSERTKFAPHCWMPFKSGIPLLYRHSRPAGEVLEVRATDKGLHMRALVRDNEAKQCTHFSVAATIHGYQLRDVDDRERFHALVTCATLDEITVTNAPANPAAIILHRYRQSASVEFWDIARRGIVCAQGIVAALRIINSAQSAPPQTVVRPVKRSLCEVPRSRPTPAKAPTRPRPKTEFRTLVDAINAMSGEVQ
ncbi:hypothetical protein [Bradyrhizobium liaoningense]|uniref:hypothetical protein n=1 Tax=Bradyrhizobium liaoningense TaxID=43992 RepID=UPI001BA5581D|nr:hypothetical protein [Bradyrhizobium liaoningense]MBR0710136.1 hypothetical protein [Bradyrhizobium liaoningense]